MLTFLRKIRRSLIGSGNTSRYLLYAVGEIALVVIGILLALQLNSWNEAQKNKEKERQVLQEIVNSIDGDLRLYEKAFDWRLETKINAIDSLLYYAGNDLPLSDEKFMEFYDDIDLGPVLRFDQGPFEALKSAGLETILNDSLRTEINVLYQVFLPAQVRFSQITEELKDPRIEELESRIMKRILVQKENGEWILRMTPKIENILTNQDFFEMLDLEADKWSSKTRRLKSIRSHLIELKEWIVKELEK